MRMCLMSRTNGRKARTFWRAKCCPSLCSFLSLLSALNLPAQSVLALKPIKLKCENMCVPHSRDSSKGGRSQLEDAGASFPRSTLG